MMTILKGLTQIMNKRTKSISEMFALTLTYNYRAGIELLIQSHYP